MTIREKIQVLQDEIAHHLARLNNDNRDEIAQEIGDCLALIRALGGFQVVNNFFNGLIAELVVYE